MTSLTVRVQRVRESTLPLPAYQTPSSAGMDLLACIDSEMTFAPFERQLVPTGLAMEIPAGWEAQVRPRSGLAFKQGLTVANAPGTIDADYRGEVKVLLINLSQQPVIIRPGDRIAQIIFAQVGQATWLPVETLSETDRGIGGFGSTGVQHTPALGAAR